MDRAGLIKISLLWVAVVASALAVTHYSHISRQTYGQLTAMQREASQLQVEYGRYLLEQSAVGSFQRVEAVATDGLRMHTPEADKIIMIKQ